MIMPGHLPVWRRILQQELPAAGDCLTIGVQDVHEEARRDPAFDFPTLTELLAARGQSVRTLDLFDPRADYRHDLNQPLPESLQHRFDMLIDIGSLEHVFDTRQALINYLALVRPGGWLCLHVPVSGYYRHGLHTFHPELIRGALTQNGCRISFSEFTDYLGNPATEDNLRGLDALLWIVANKTTALPDFRIPQQAGWQEYYSPPPGP